MPLKIAIVGSGVSGLAALWALKETEHEVHLFEAQDHLGGHVQTVEWRGDNGEKTLVDIAFALFNQVTYPNFCAFLSHMKIPAIPARPTFGLSRDDGRFEWSSTSLFTLFVQWRNIFSLAMWQMVFDIARFNLSASKALDPAYPFKFETVGEFLRRNRYSDPFQNDYFIPLVSSLWIHDPRETLNSIPMVMVVRYLHNHQLLNVNPFRSSLQWLMVDGGAKRYVDAILDGIPPDRLHTSSPVAAVRAHGKGLSLTLDNGSVRHFDRVIMATRAPASLRILGEYATKPMKNALEKFKTSLSSVTLHSDTRLMPRNRLAWSAWNYHASSSTGQVSLTADMAHLLGRPEKGPILTTLNPYRTPDPALTQGVFTYEHPIFDGHSVAAQKSIKSIQGQSNVWFAGAWLGYGFHEDGFTSGIKAAQMVCPEINLPFGLREWELGDSQEESWTQKLVAFFTGMVVFAWMRRLYPVVRKMIKARKIA